MMIATQGSNYNCYMYVTKEKSRWFSLIYSTKLSLHLMLNLSDFLCRHHLKIKFKDFDKLNVFLYI